MPGFLAYVIPISGDLPHPEHPIVNPPPGGNIPGLPNPPGIWGPLPGFPTPPISNVPGAPGSGNPPGIWGGSNQPFPTPPIANVPGVPPSGNPPGIWGGSNEPFPTPPISNVPGVPGFPGSGLHPAHPIVIPDPPIDVPPPGGNAGTPEHPINKPPADPPGETGYWAQAYFPGVGWMWVWVPVEPNK